jgi:hypothetical protein
MDPATHSVFSNEIEINCVPDHDIPTPFSTLHVWSYVIAVDTIITDAVVKKLTSCQPDAIQRYRNTMLWPWMTKMTRQLNDHGYGIERQGNLAALLSGASCVNWLVICCCVRRGRRVVMKAI